MNNPIVFVDVDGPLAWGTFFNGRVTIEALGNSEDDIVIPYPWVTEDCAVLSELVESTEAYIVVSSDWKKHYTLKQLRTIFQHYGISANRVIDTTTHYNPAKKMSSPGEWDRACEIKSWVKTFRPKHWIAVDDMPLGTYFKQLGVPKWRHVQVDGGFGNGGRLRYKLEECIKKLNR